MAEHTSPKGASRVRIKSWTDLYVLMSDLGFPSAFRLPRGREVGQSMQHVHGAGDGGPNRWLSYSHPRIFTA